MTLPSNAANLAEVLIQERQPLLRFLARYMDWASCEDAYQTMYFKVAAVPRNPPILDPRGYLYRIAYHLAVDRMRAEQRERNARREAAALLMADDGVEDGNRTLPARADLQKLTGTVLSLPEPTRRIFLLNRYHGMPERQIAALLGVSKSLIAKHIRRALAHIQAQHGG